MNNKRPGELNKKIKRLQTSRDNLKLNNREKNLINQKLRDKAGEIAESRKLWKTRYKEVSCQKQELEQQVQAAREEAERERVRAHEERKRADKLQSEIEIVLEKKSRA